MNRIKEQDVRTVHISALSRPDPRFRIDCFREPEPCKIRMCFQVCLYICQNRSPSSIAKYWSAFPDRSDNSRQVQQNGDTMRLRRCLFSGAVCPFLPEGRLGIRKPVNLVRFVFERGISNPTDADVGIIGVITAPVHKKTFQFRQRTEGFAVVDGFVDRCITFDEFIVK